MKTFSIIVPVYQNEANLGTTIPTLLGLGAQLPEYRLELVLVNDGSTDRSQELLDAFQAEHPEQLRVLRLTRNFGQTPAIREGLRAATGDCIGIISADLQDPPELFVDMVRHWEQGTPLVIAERSDREEGGVHRFLSSLYWKMVARYAVEGFPEGGFDFCVLDRRIQEDLNRIGEKNTSIFPLMFWLGYEHVSLPYTRRLRTAGTSQWTLRKRVKLTVDTFFNFTYLPVKLITVFGLMAALLSGGYGAYYLVRYLAYGSSAPPGWTSLALLIVFFGGLTLFSLGIAAEYLWRILDEVRRRPNSVVAEHRETRAAEPPHVLPQREATAEERAGSPRAPSKSESGDA